MASLIEPGVWRIQERTLVLPARIRDASFFAASFACPADAAAEILAGTRMTPVSIRGRAVSTLACIQYRDCDLGNYDEVGLQVLVRGPDRRIGLFTVELPVTQAFTLEAGREIWGMPKWMARTTQSVTNRRAVVEVREGDTLALRAELDAGPARLPVRLGVTAPTWSTRPEGPLVGQALSGAFRIAVRDLRVRPGGTTVTLGTHRMSETARALGLSGRALCTIGSPRLTGALGAPTPHG